MESVEIPGSHRSEPEGAEVIGEVHQSETIGVTVYLRTPAEQRRLPWSRGRAASRAELRQERALKFGPAYECLEKFAAQSGLLLELDPGRRSVHLRGSARSMQRAFAASLRIYKDSQRRFRARSGSLSAPRDVVPWIDAVLGFDGRPVVMRREQPQFGASGSAGLWPSEVARLYDLPPEADGAGQCIGLIALGGGYWPGDLVQAVEGLNLPQPVVVDSSVGGAKNEFHGGDPSDQELALDMQVVAGIVPRARIVVYFAANNTQSLAGAIEQAVSDHVNRPQILSISWGSAEKFWTLSARDAIQTALSDAVTVKMTVLAAAGDALATAGLTDGKAHVLYPASNPLVLACGGTQMAMSEDEATLRGETVWNEEFTGTGGGISDVFDVPDYQQSASIPSSYNDGRRGRGVPDLTAAAAQNPGYKIIVGGQTIVKDGTSAATPLWASVIAMANAKRGRPLGYLHPFLYRNPMACRAVLEGNNRSQGIGYDAGPGWNACAGWGAPNGSATVNTLASMP